MDDPRNPSEASGLPVQGPHWGAPLVPLRLVLRPGGAVVDLTRPDMLIGRHTDADVRLALPDISRRHCRVVFTDNRWQVFDLNSLNGLFVNGERVQQAVLNDGDTVRIGGLTFAVELGAERTADEPPKTARNVATRTNTLRSIADALPMPQPDAMPPRRKAS
jgi:pSer/pThr/pTyr-binding forkhead associated (FHA) protein